MKSLIITFWAESLKVRKSKILWITMVFFAFVAFMMGLIVFLQQHPEMAQKLGLIGVKANMLRFGEPNWENYLTLLSQGMAGVGLIGFGFITSWIFGREYSDHTIKDILALPASRSSFVISKLIVVMLWSILLAIIFVLAGLLFGKIAGITGWTNEIFTQFLFRFTMVSLLTILLCTPAAFFASYSNGFLLPVGIVILTMMMANFAGLVGVGPYFPWAIPAMFCVPSGKPVEIHAVSYLILVGTSILGFVGTLAWWRFADQK
jgi:ABC-type transport system involved in multi-copper enzyme maturation permease subunit